MVVYVPRALKFVGSKLSKKSNDLPKVGRTSKNNIPISCLVLKLFRDLRIGLAYCMYNRYPGGGLIVLNIQKTKRKRLCNLDYIRLFIIRKLTSLTNKCLIY